MEIHWPYTVLVWGRWNLLWNEKLSYILNPFFWSQGAFTEPKSTKKGGETGRGERDKEIISLPGKKTKTKTTSFFFPNPLKMNKQRWVILPKRTAHRHTQAPTPSRTAWRGAIWTILKRETCFSSVTPPPGRLPPLTVYVASGSSGLFTPTKTLLYLLRTRYSAGPRGHKDKQGGSGGSNPL